MLGTNDPTLTADEQLATSKRRDVPEKRYALLKGPLAVRPVFLHQQERILSLVFCTMVALLVFALLEWAARRVGERDSGTVLLARFAELRVLVLPLPRRQPHPPRDRPRSVRRRTARTASAGRPPPATTSSIRNVSPCRSPCEIQTKACPQT